MTPLFQARRRAEDFAAAVDGRAVSRDARGEEVATLLEVVGALRAQPLAEPRAEFAADLRGRLMLEAETALRPESASLRLRTAQPGRRERRLAAAAAAFVLIGGTTTMAAAAQSALPGDALYPVKRVIERAEVGLRTSSAGKGSELLDQAADRLVEVEGLLTSDSPQSGPRVAETLAAFSESAEGGATLLFEAYDETTEPATVIEVRTFAADAIATLERLAGEVPADAQDELTAAAILVSDIDKEAAGLCGTCAADLPSVGVPDILLARADVARALELTAGRELDNNHPVPVPNDILAGLREAAENAPAAPDPTTGTGSSDESVPSAALPTPSVDPEAWPSLLPGLGSDAKADDKDATVAEKVQDDIETTLDGVTTLLPETDTNLLD